MEERKCAWLLASKYIESRFLCTQPSVLEPILLMISISQLKKNEVFKTIWYSAAPTVTITVQTTKRCYFSAGLECICCFKILMKGRGIKSLRRSSVLMMPFSFGQTRNLNDKAASFLFSNLKLCLRPCTSISPEKSKVHEKSPEHLLFPQMPSIPHFKVKNKPTKHFHTE